MFAKIRIVDTVFERVCEMLHSAFHQSDTHLSASSMRRLLLIMSDADSSLVEVCPASKYGNVLCSKCTNLFQQLTSVVHRLNAQILSN